MLKLVIFDLDGTIASTNNLIFDSFNYILKKYHNITLTESQLISKFGPPEYHLILDIFGQKSAQKIYDDYLNYYKLNHKRSVSLYPNIKDLFQFLKSKSLHLSVFTGKGKATTEISLVELEISQYFDYICTGDDVKNFKPAPEGIFNTLNYFNVNHNEAIMIGDSVHDILASNTAKVKILSAVWDSYGKNEVEKFNPNNLFYSIENLILYFKNILK